MRHLFYALLALCLALPAVAQDTIPDRRLALSENLDFYGGDLTPVFDTDFQTCKKLCMGDAACAAFTFNAVSGACFPKTGVTDTQVYDGAISGRVFDTPTGIMAQADIRAAELGFLSASDLSAARAQAEALAERHLVNDWTESALSDAAFQAKRQGNLLGAFRFTGAALTLTDAPGDWLDYGRLAAALSREDKSNRSAYRRSALQAATNAYLRADGPRQQAQALAVMAAMLEQLGRGRDMIPALRLANDLVPQPETAEALDNAIAKYGFRVTGHDVQNETAEPRVCAEFSEPLVQAGVDYAPFVQVVGEKLAVEVSDRQLCLTGVRHGERYEVTIRAGLPAASGEVTAGPVTLTLYVRDRAPVVRFPGRGYVLPKGGEVAIPVATVNATRLDLTLSRVSDRALAQLIREDSFGRPMSEWEMEDFRDSTAVPVWQGEADVALDLNAEVTTRLPLDAAGNALAPGLYTLEARVVGGDARDTAPALQWFMISDLGLTTYLGNDGLHVFARGLADTGAKPGLKVELISTGNAVLGTAVTDADGYARFDAGLTRGVGAAAPALVAVTAADDFAFLSLTAPEFDLSDRGVDGRPVAPPIDLFLTTDRGAYRAGEVIHATVLTRDQTMAALPGLPLTAVLTRPDGVEYSRTRIQEAGAGGGVVSFNLGQTVPRGTWTLSVFADLDAPALRTAPLLVEDFMPERIDLVADLPEGSIGLDDTPDLTVQVDYLFGAAGADLPVTGEVVLRPAAGLPEFPGLRFGRHDLRARAAYDSLPSIRTDASGAAVLPVTLPRPDQLDRPYEATFTLRAREGAGRPVERQITRPVRPATDMIGIRPLFDGALGEGAVASFELQGVAPDLAPASMEVTWTLNRVEYRYQWYQQYGQWNWEPITRRKKIQSGTATLGNTPVLVETPVDWGTYELVVERNGAEYAAASVGFNAGWYGAGDGAGTPDRLEVALNKPSFVPGETATLRIVPEAAGTALVTVMSDRLIDRRVVAVVAGENSVDLPVTADWGAGAYVTATLLQPSNRAARQMPARALGLAYAGVDPGARRIGVTLEVPELIRPRGPMDVTIAADGVPGETVYATLAAVDVGILNLTGFQSPDPADHYFGQRKLGMGIRDVYGRLIDGMNGALGVVRSGGGAATGLTAQAPPPTEDLAAFFAGPVTLDENGRATVTFDLGAFNGTLRVMAVVWSQTGVGQASRDVIARDPVVLSTTLPRFLAPGDASALRMELTQADGPGGAVPISVMAEGPVTLDTRFLPKQVQLPKGGREVLSVPITGDAVGDAVITVALTLPDGETVSTEYRLGVRANDPEVVETTRFSLAAGETLRIDDNIFAGFRPGSAHAVLTAGPLARFDAPAILTALDRYPFGCTEQITSRALPLLYVSPLAQAMGMAQDHALSDRLQQAVDTILTRQAANGAFGLWRPASGDLWLDAYVSDFLGRARSEGIAVPDRALRSALDNLSNRVNYAPDFDNGGEAIAYALMVLAREGIASIGDLRYFADAKADAFATPLAQAQLGAALAYYGDQPRADRMFAKAAARLRAQVDAAVVYRSDYGTQRRDAAAVLTLAVEAGSQVVDRDRLIALAAQSDGPRSTQEAAWAMLATHALLTEPQGALIVNGRRIDGAYVEVLEHDTFLAALDIQTTASGSEPLTLTSFGVPRDPRPASGLGYSIDRLYFTMDGAPIQPDQVPAGTRLVTVVKVTPTGAPGGRLMVTDPLPAGFEIDNPNLLRSGDVRALDWLDTDLKTRNTEFLTDRFRAAVDHFGDASFQLAYIVRAVAPGRYHHPAPSVEDMYRPKFRAQGNAGRIEILP